MHKLGYPTMGDLACKVYENKTSRSIALNQCIPNRFRSSTQSQASSRVMGHPGSAALPTSYLIDCSTQMATSPCLFKVLHHIWRPYFIHLFASFTISQLPFKNCKHFYQSSVGVDCSQHHNNFINPPFRLIPRVL